nr:MAG TPA: hypothetical protein [Caudoviricetes sp.]
MAASFLIRTYTRTSVRRVTTYNGLQRLCCYQSVQRCWG